jgi:hypothetical protein
MLKQDKLEILVFIKILENRSKLQLILIDLKITQTKTIYFGLGRFTIDFFTYF